ncbi:hypothetical protein O6H91_17G067100 [Diphasiastrum complanatum]|uniref:Uncharacterized protein n=5 Tax=Diphasiastrum complanatum TaxID=34168 RepID=A0ACC2B7Q7_DIPCM|nr:hypothetical protein O6H91_17G067100 [Diphasiastrum complanatum]KAJ7525793.1 hypothetical protein O6H91_17G067100 [Diphasiastrum complanatum]KAJ7525794.1 hypothetical protein O6H91_17G067100 [Diphasiastrum complanatum]KAJ7525795.1 hypothetical protein O6H91_17G067100 [Diphasiastrum complanatum]
MSKISWRSLNWSFAILTRRPPIRTVSPIASLPLLKARGSTSISCKKGHRRENVFAPLSMKKVEIWSSSIVTCTSIDLVKSFYSTFVPSLYFFSYPGQSCSFELREPRVPCSLGSSELYWGCIYRQNYWPLKGPSAFPFSLGVSYMPSVHQNYSTVASSALNRTPALEADVAAESDLHYTEALNLEASASQDWHQHEDCQEAVSSFSQTQPLDVYIPVEAFFIAGNVDLKGLSEEPFVDVISGRKHLVIRCQDHPHAAYSLKATGTEESWRTKRYMVVFQWGSVVLFNFRSSKEEETINIVKRHCKDIFKEEIKDTYGVLVRPTLDRYSQGGQDKIMVKTLDTDGLRIISLILSQSIALDHYTKAIDGMLTTFGELNRTMELTGNFKLHRKKLFQLVASANSTLSDAILRIGLLERSDVAWQNANYDRIWSFLREDFELDERFESLEKKTDIIQHNVKFYLDILQNRKSDFLEWIIIVLITGEIMVSLYDILHDTGTL